MPVKSNQRKKVAQWNKAKWKSFVSVRLTRQEKQAVKENLLEEDSGYEFLMNAATAGYKCSISYSIPEDVYTVSLTGLYQEKPNGGLTLSLRHRDLIVAVTAMSWILREDGLSAEWSERFDVRGDDDW